jgi:NADH:ubiquinone oxidoreductase subunit K
MGKADYHLLHDTLFVSVLLFAVGVMGIIARRNRIATVISYGILLQACMLWVIGFSTFHADFHGRNAWLVVLITGLIGMGIALACLFSSESRSVSAASRSTEISHETGEDGND